MSTTASSTRILPAAEAPDPGGRLAFPPPGWAVRLDGRLKILLLLAACAVSQRLPAMWLPVWLAGLACLFAIREARSRWVLGMARGGVVFALFWLAMKALTDWWGGQPIAQALWGGLPLAGRLLALTLAGALFAGLSSPLETGRAVAWGLRPVMGRRAWKPALMVALVAWFLPLTLRLAGEIGTAIRARGLRLSWWRRVVLTVGTALGILFRKADDLALGLASRRLDDERVWR